MPHHWRPLAYERIVENQTRYSLWSKRTRTILPDNDLMGRRFLDTSIYNSARYPAGHVLGECPDNWVTFQNSCYLFAHTDHTFPDAQVLNVY